MARTHLVAVGACAVDNILTVPYFPQEDSKLRALSFTKRRGGNCPNTLEVLSQLTNAFTVNASTTSSTDHVNLESNVPGPVLSLISTLPARSSPQIPLIASSFGVARDTSGNGHTRSNLEDSPVDLSRCIYREGYAEPISSYIMFSQATSSRTIVNHNELPEMTFDEFVESTRDILASVVVSDEDRERNRPSLIWFHFEGRIPETTLECMRYLRRHSTFNDPKAPTTLRISVELEKPGREGLQELAFEADVIFYSRSWAEAEGYNSMEVCLKEQAKVFRGDKGKDGGRERLLICTWNDQGACALQLPSLDDHSRSTRQRDEIDGDMLKQRIIHSPAYIDRGRPILDTVGAGDTFIAGMLFGLICRSQGDLSSHDSTVALGEAALRRQPLWSIRQKLDFANGVAGRKVLQHGFQGLGGQLGDLVRYLDHGVVD